MFCAQMVETVVAEARVAQAPLAQAELPNYQCIL
jgi:hypothetical protein